MITAKGSDGKVRTYKDSTSKEINFALSHGGTVDLEPNVTYTILDSLLFGSNTTLNGNGAILKLAKGLPVWGGRKVSIAQEKAMLMIRNSSASNVAINGVTVDGSQSDYYPHIRLGTSSYNMATIIGVNGITIKNCTFRNGCNDAMMFNKSKKILVDGVTVHKPGHDGVATYYVEDITVQNSVFENRTNSSIRLYNVTGGICKNNKMSTTGGGYTGVELQGALKNISIDTNYIKGLPAPGIVSLGASMNKVVISNNTIVNCKSPGISAKGATLINNTIR